MNSHILLGIIFLMAGIFQSITAVLVFRGQQHYILKVTNRKVGFIIYLLIASLLYFMAWFNLAHR